MCDKWVTFEEAKPLEGLYVVVAFAPECFTIGRATVNSVEWCDSEGGDESFLDLNDSGAVWTYYTFNDKSLQCALGVAEYVAMHGRG